MGRGDRIWNPHTRNDQKCLGTQKIHLCNRRSMYRAIYTISYWVQWWKLAEFLWKLVFSARSPAKIEDWKGDVRDLIRKVKVKEIIVKDRKTMFIDKGFKNVNQIALRVHLTWMMTNIKQDLALLPQPSPASHWLYWWAMEFQLGLEGSDNRRMRGSDKTMMEWIDCKSLWG